MKQTYYYPGLLAVLLISAGTVFKVNHFPGAAAMIVTGMLMLVLVFLPLALMSNYRVHGSRQNSSLYLVTWLTCAVMFTSMVFKILHWPGAGILVLIALPFPFVVFLPVYLMVTSRIKNFNIFNTVYVLFFLAAISVLSSLLAL